MQACTRKGVTLYLKRAISLYLERYLKFTGVPLYQDKILNLSLLWEGWYHSSTLVLMHKQVLGRFSLAMERFYSQASTRRVVPLK